MLVRHALGWYRILAADVLLLLLHVLLVCHLLLLLRGHVVLRDASATGHVCLGRGDLRVVYFFGRFDIGFTINTILSAGGRLRRVEACLELQCVRVVEDSGLREALPG